MEGEPALAWAPSRPMLSSGRVSGRLVGQTGKELGFHCSHYLSQVLLLLSLWREGPVCVGSGQAVFSLPAPEPGPGVVHSQVNSWQQQLERLRSPFPPDCLTLRRPKPTPADSGGCIPPTVWAPHHSQLLAMAPSLGLCLPLLFSRTETVCVCGVGIAGDQGFSTSAPLAFGVRSWGLSCAL